MTTITVTLKGQADRLQDALVCACRYYSQSAVKDSAATITYICEGDRDAAIDLVQESIDLTALESLGVTLRFA